MNKTEYEYKTRFIDIGASGTERYQFEIQFIRLKGNGWYYKIVDIPRGRIIYSSLGDIKNELKDVIFDAGARTWIMARKYMKQKIEEGNT